MTVLRTIGARLEGRWSRVGAAVAAVAVLALVVLRPGAEDSAREAAPGQPEATAAPTPTDEEWCTGWRALAEAQGRYAMDPEGGEPALVDAAEGLLERGIPEQMSLLARGGYFLVMEGVYGSLNLTLDPDRVPGVDAGAQPEGAYPAFSSYLARRCPA